MAVPGHEELNSMFTTLDMRDNSVRNVRELQFEHHAFGDTAACGDTEQEGRVFLDADQGLYLWPERSGGTHRGHGKFQAV